MPTALRPRQVNRERADSKRGKYFENDVAGNGCVITRCEPRAFDPASRPTSRPGVALDEDNAQPFHHWWISVACPQSLKASPMTMTNAMQATAATA